MSKQESECPPNSYFDESAQACEPCSSRHCVPEGQPTVPDCQSLCQAYWQAVTTSPELSTPDRGDDGSSGLHGEHYVALATVVGFFLSFFSFALLAFCIVKIWKSQKKRCARHKQVLRWNDRELQQPEETPPPEVYLTSQDAMELLPLSQAPEETCREWEGSRSVMCQTEIEHHTGEAGHAVLPGLVEADCSSHPHDVHYLKAANSMAGSQGMIEAADPLHPEICDLTDGLHQVSLTEISDRAADLVRCEQTVPKMLSFDFGTEDETLVLCAKQARDFLARQDWYKLGIASGRSFEVYVQNISVHKATESLFRANPVLRESGYLVNIWDIEDFKICDLHGQQGDHLGVGSMCFFEGSTRGEKLCSTIGGFLGTADDPDLVYMVTTAHCVPQSAAFYLDRDLSSCLGSLAHGFCDRNCDMAFVKVDSAYKNDLCNVVKMPKLGTTRLEFYIPQIYEEDLRELAWRTPVTKIVRHGPGERGQACGHLAIVDYRSADGDLSKCLGIVPDDDDADFAVPGDSGSLITSAGGECKNVDAYGLLAGSMEVRTRGSIRRRVGVIAPLSVGIEKLRAKEGRNWKYTLDGVRMKHLGTDSYDPDSGHGTMTCSVITPSHSTFFTASTFDSTS